jgi:hypothetical protein
MVKGIRPLNLELSWMYVISAYSQSVVGFMFVPSSPFKYGNKVPTNEEVSRVSEDILGDLTILIGQGPRERDEVRRLLDDLVSPIPSDPISSLAFLECTHPEDFVVAEILYNDSIRPYQLVLTRDERHRISRTSADLFRPPIRRLLQLAGSAGNDTVPEIDGGESPFEELEFSSQIPPDDFTELEHPRLRGREDDDEEFVLAPAKRRRLRDFSPVVDDLLESPLESPESEKMRHPVRPLVVEPAPGAEVLDNRHFPQFPPAQQGAHVPPDATSQPPDPVRPNLSDITHHSVPPATGQATGLGHAPATGGRREFVEFLAMRGVRLDAPPAVATIETLVDNPPPTETLPVLQPLPTGVPPDLIDANTIQLPAANSWPVSRHQYLASLDLLQKHALCRCLSDNPAAIDLIEREFLGGVDLILDQDTAIMFLPLSTIPSECEGLIAGISDISWRYSRILVIFEAFLISQAFSDGEENRIVSFTFTEPVLKSVKKLKRSLAIADGVGTKAADCSVSWAFARDIEEAAGLARVYGDMAESRDQTGGLLWQERWWLGEREAEDSPLSEFEVRSAFVPNVHPCLMRWEWSGRKRSCNGCGNERLCSMSHPFPNAIGPVLESDAPRKNRKV